MTLVLELPPEVEQRLRDEAARQGQPVEEYALSRILGPMPVPEEKPFYETATPEEWEREFRAWAASHDYITAPVIPMQALRRESMYKD